MVAGRAFAIEARGVSLSFGAHRALRDVSIALRPGEVHAVVGENGAGKSTLLKILAGVHRDWDGEVLVGGRPARFRSPADAMRAGVAAIHQELSLVGPMSVTDNVLLGLEGGAPLRPLRPAARRARARGILGALRVDADADAAVEDLPIATRQLVEIARALARESRVVLMDEPTSALGEDDVGALRERIRGLRDRGTAVAYVSHRLDEVYAVADRITVLRDGAVVGSAPPEDLPRDRLIAWMTGAEAAPDARAGRRAPGEVVLEVRSLSASGTGRSRRSVGRGLDGVRLEIRAGEIVGLGGLPGSGRAELLHALFGSFPGVVEGEVILAGRSLGRRSPARSIAAGAFLVPSDRQAAGIVHDASVVHNATLAAIGAFSTLGWMDRRREERAVEATAGDLGLRGPSLRAPASALSGGNQQKLLLARCALAGARVLLLDDPTRGVDVGARADIHARLRAWTEAGAAIVFTSSDPDELVALADRVVVLRDGCVAATLDGGDLTRERVLRAAAGSDG